MPNFTNDIAIVIGINNYHHLLIILDCCFVGTFRWSSTRKAIPIPEAIPRQRYDHFIRYPAWQVIASSAHNQEALDFLSDKRGISKKMSNILPSPKPCLKHCRMVNPMTKAPAK